MLGSRGVTPRILDLYTRWRFVVCFTLWHLYSQGKSPCYPLDRRLGGEHSGEKRNSQPLPGLEPPIIQTIGHSYTTAIATTKPIHSFMQEGHKIKLSSVNGPLYQIPNT
jgi:hypothetical protein